jgi:hypothetical protein
MANEALINLLDWCKRERENLQCQLDALKAGRFKTHSNDGSGWNDTTQDSIERVEENIWELSKLILRSEAGRRFERYRRCNEMNFVSSSIRAGCYGNGFCANAGSLAIFAAIVRASSLLSSLADERRPGSSSK